MPSGDFSDLPTPEASSGPADRGRIAREGTDTLVGEGGPFRVRFTRRGPAEVTARLGRGASLRFHYEGGESRPGEADGGTVRFRDVAEAVDVEYEILAGGLKEVVLLKRRATAGEDIRFRFPLQAKGLSARNDDDGSVGLYDAAGRRVAFFPDGVVTDSSPDPLSAPVDVRLVDGDVLEVRPDPALVSSEAALPPFRVDPTLMSGNNPPPAPGGLRPWAPPGATSATVTTTTPTPAADPVVDGDGPQPVRYLFRVSNTDDPDIGQVLNSGYLTSPSFPVPEGSLVDGMTYSWRVGAYDGEATTWSGTGRLKVNQRLGSGGPTPVDTGSGVAVNMATGNAAISLGSRAIGTVGGPLGVSYA